MKAMILSGILALTGLSLAGVAMADDDYLEHQAQQRAKISYEEAQKLAVRAVGGGMATDIDFELGFGGGYYEVDVFLDHLQHEIRIDANTGKVLSKRIDD